METYPTNNNFNSKSNPSKKMFDPKTIVLLVIIFALIIFFIILLSSQSSSHTEEINKIKDDLKKSEEKVNAAKSEADKAIKNFLEQANNKFIEISIIMVRSISTTLFNEIKENNFKEIEEYFNYLVQQKSILYMILVDKEGRVLATTNQKYSGQTLSDDLTKKAINSTEVTFSKLEHEKEIEVSAPIFQFSDVTAALRVGIQLPTIDTNIGK